MSWSCQVFINIEALDDLPRTGKKREQVLDGVRSLHDHYHLGGDFEKTDPKTGRVFQISVIRDYAVTWWEDGPVREVQVVDICQIGTIPSFN